MDRRDGVAGVILAAGTSSRMGRNKLLLQLEGRSVLRRAVDTALAAGLDPVLVVVGHQREQAEAELAGLRCTVVERYRGGDAPLVVSSYEGVDAPPILYDRSLFDELRVLEGEGCGKKVVKRHTEEALRISWPAKALTDLDLPADVERVRIQLEEGR